MILAMVSNIKAVYKTISMSVLLVLVLLCHYTVGILAIIYLLALFGVKVIGRFMKWGLLKQSKLNLISLSIILIIGVGSFVGYYSYASNGLIMQIVSRVAVSYFNPSNIDKSPALPKYELYNNNIDRDSSVNAAFGSDFMEVSWLGKLFRIIQIVTQLMIIIGVCYLVFRYQKYKFTTEFMVYIGSSIGLLACCIWLPFFAHLTGVVRFYHTSLFFLAPMFVIGFDMFTRKPKEIDKEKQIKGRLRMLGYLD